MERNLLMREALAGVRPVFAICRRNPHPSLMSPTYYTARLDSSNKSTSLVLFADRVHADAVAASLEDHFYGCGSFPTAHTDLLLTRDQREPRGAEVHVREVRLDEFVRVTRGSEVRMAIAYDVTWAASHAMFRTCTLRMRAGTTDKAAWLQKRIDAVPTGSIVPIVPRRASSTRSHGPRGLRGPHALEALLPKPKPKRSTATRAAMDQMWCLVLVFFRIMFD